MQSQSKVVNVLGNGSKRRASFHLSTPSVKAQPTE